MFVVHDVFQPCGVLTLFGTVLFDIVLSVWCSSTLVFFLFVSKMSSRTAVARQVFICDGPNTFFYAW